MGYSQESAVRIEVRTICVCVCPTSLPACLDSVTLPAQQADCNPAFASAIIQLMHISDPREVEEVLSFFRTHLGRELDIAVSMFEGLTQYERMRVQEVDAAPPRILLLAPKSQRQIAIDPHQFSFATVSPDHTRLEVGRLLGSNLTMRLTARELA